MTIMSRGRVVRIVAINVFDDVEELTEVPAQPRLSHFHVSGRVGGGSSRRQLRRFAAAFFARGVPC
jgi:hypothetical protein